MPAKPKLIAMTIGDPAGIGPEVCVKAAQTIFDEKAVNLLLIGDLALIQEAGRRAGCSVEFRQVPAPQEVGTDFVGVMDPLHGAPIKLVVGTATAEAGHAALAWVDFGRRLGQAGKIDGLVFGPVNSDALKLTGLIENIDDLQPEGTYMLRVNGGLRVMPIAEHVPMRDVAATVTTDAVVSAARRLAEALCRWGFDRPRIGVAALNPHAMFEEDREQIKPAVDLLAAEGIAASGPISPDAVFRRAMGGEFDAVLTMYHDQGQIALKTVAFSGGCTIYVGDGPVMIAIPHGTAYDIAGMGKADPASMVSGIRMASRLASGSGFSG